MGPRSCSTLTPLDLVRGLTARLGLLVATLAVGAPAAGQEHGDAFAALRAREIGPAGMSGRVSDVEVVLSDRSIIYVGSATGGVFRSRDGGITWDPIFDDQPAIGVGSVAVFQPNPDIVWVGTGEGNPRNSAGVGRGLFKSIDGGETWQSMGFEGSERIHRVVTHPADPDVVYVGVLGPAWSDGEERGVYRTRDGGASWERVLWQTTERFYHTCSLWPHNLQQPGYRLKPILHRSRSCPHTCRVCYQV